MNLLSKIKKSDLILEPFPHLVIPEVIEARFARRLFESLPGPELITGGLFPNNARFNYSALKVLAEPSLASIWKEFVSAHISQDFFNDFLRIFGDEVKKLYPGLERKYGELEALKVGTRFKDSFETKTVLLDAQLALNTPVREVSSVSPLHFDAPNELFAGLFYLRHPEDDSKGGEFEIHQVKGELRFQGRELVSEVQKIKSIPYQNNTLVFFLNSLNSFHAVSPRSPTKFPRWFLNVIAEAPKPLFSTKEHQAGRAEILWSKLWPKQK